MKPISEYPAWVIALLAGSFMVAAWALTTDNWNQNTQMLTFGLFAIGALSMLSGEEKVPVTQKEAENAAYKYIRYAQTEGRIPTGNIKVMTEARKVLLDAQPVYWEVGIKIDATEAGNPVYPVRVDMHKYQGQVLTSGVTNKDDWTAQKSPDISVIIPPDAVTYMKMKHKFESEGK